MFDAIGNVASAGINAWQGDKNRESQERIAAQNIALQREFAQSGIQWKVADAQKAGIHPLAALGAQTSSFSPVSVGSTESSMGQDIGRAIKAAGSMFDREDKDKAEATKLALEKGHLENDILRAELVSKGVRAMQGGQLGPQMPVGSTTTNRVPLPRPGPLRSYSGEAVKDDDLKQKSESVFPVKELPFYGFNVRMPKWMSSGQDWEDAIGELGGSVMGALSIPGIAAHNVWERLPDNMGQDLRQWYGGLREPRSRNQRPRARR